MMRPASKSSMPASFASLARASMRLPTACATKKAPRVLVLKMKSKSSSRTSCKRCVLLTPELLIKISMGPTSRSAKFNAASMLPTFVTSKATTCASPPSASISARKALSISTRRLANTTAAPAAAKVFANCAPKPLEAPVTKATRPDKSSVYAILNSCRTVHYDQPLRAASA